MRVARNDPKIIVINNDGHGGFYEDLFASAEDLREYVHGYADTHLSVLEWGVNCGSRVNFPSQTMEIMGSGVEEFPRRGDRTAHENMQALIDEGVDSLAVIAESCDEIDKRCHVSLRMNPDYEASWMGEGIPNIFNSDFWWEHPELRVVDWDGNRTAKLSYGYGQVRKWKLALAEEVLQRPVDGINLDFLRHPPFVGTEDVMIEGFEDEHGLDARDLPDDDPRRIEYWCRPMTRFMRDLRKIADETGRPIEITARVDHRDYLQQGLDIETWLAEGLLDILIMSEHGLGGFEFDPAPFAGLAHRHDGLVLFGEEHVLGGHDLTPEEDAAIAAGTMEPPERPTLSATEYCKRALRSYEAGCDGIHIFNNAADPNIDILQVLHSPQRCREYLSEAVG